MRLPILLIAVISTVWAETKKVERPVRASQRQIKYDDADDTKVEWKYIVPQSQWQSHLISAERPQRADSGSPQRLRQVQRAPQRTPAPQPAQQQQQQQQLQPVPQYIQNQQYYRPYSALPGHIKQLIEQNYQPQSPYVDPTSFLYSASFVAPQQQEQQPAPAASEIPRSAYLQPSARYQSIDPRKAQPRLEYSDRRVERQDRVLYKEDYDQQQQQLEQQQQQQQQQQAQAVLVPVGTMPEPPLPTLYLDKNMPTEIKQLLQYQAQIPYDVIANRIQYKPKSLFIPKPLPDDVKGPYYYRSKIYYTDEDGADAEYPQEKPVDEERRH